MLTHPPNPFSSLSWVCIMSSPGPLSHAITMVTAHSMLYPSRHVSHSNECLETHSQGGHVLQAQRPTVCFYVPVYDRSHKHEGKNQPGVMVRKQDRTERGVKQDNKPVQHLYIHFLVV